MTAGFEVRFEAAGEVRDAEGNIVNNKQGEDIAATQED